MAHRQLDIFRHTEAGRDMRSTLQEAQALTLQSFEAYGQSLDTWVFGFSGGKDSTALVTFADYAFRKKLLKPPAHKIVLYSDTLMELPSLEYSAHRVLAQLESHGWRVIKSVPRLDTPINKPERFMVMMLGRGYPPPSNRFRWCTDRLKIRSIKKLYRIIKDEYGSDFLNINGVRRGESSARDKLIYAACNKDDGECGQGLYQMQGSEHKLSPVLHWRICHIWDWIIEAWSEHGYQIEGVIDTYGVNLSDEIIEPLSSRTGCIGCPLVTASNQNYPRQDKALNAVLENSDWDHLAPYSKLSDIYWRLRWDKSCRHIKTSGKPGCLSLTARQWALDKILELQRESIQLALSKNRTPYLLIKEDEELVIRDMLKNRIFPDPRNYPDGELEKNVIMAND